MGKFDAKNIYDVVAIDKDGYHEHVIDKYNNAKDLTILKIHFNSYNQSLALLGIDVVDYAVNTTNEKVYYILSNNIIKISDINNNALGISPGKPIADNTRIVALHEVLTSGAYKMHLLIVDRNTEIPKAYGSVEFVIS